MCTQVRTQIEKFLHVRLSTVCEVCPNTHTRAHARSRTHSAFSEGMDWANFSPPFDILGDGEGGRGGRRTAKECAACGLCTGRKLIEKLIVCVSILAIVFGLRWLCCTLYMRKYPQEPKPPDMSFPNWEVRAAGAFKMSSPRGVDSKMYLFMLYC